MGKGILGGAILGAVVAVFGAGILSLLAPPPKRAVLPDPALSAAPPPVVVAPSPAPGPAAKPAASPAPAPVARTPEAAETAPAPQTAPQSAPPNVETVDLPAGQTPPPPITAPLPEEHARIVVAPEASPPAQPTAPADPKMAETAPAALPQPLLQPEPPQVPVPPDVQGRAMAALPAAPELPDGRGPGGVSRPSAETPPAVPPTATPLPVPAPTLPAPPTAPAPAAPPSPVVEPLPEPATPAAPLPPLVRPGPDVSPVEDGADPSPSAPPAAPPVAEPAPAPQAPLPPLPRVVRPGTDPAPADDAPVPEDPEPPQSAAQDRAPGALRVAVPGREIAVPNVRVNRLPSIGGEAPAPAAPGTTPDDRSDAAPEADTALARNAIAFEPEAGKPLFSVLLVDDPGARLQGAALRDLAFPVTFVVDASQTDASIAARAYRDAGHEVILMAGGLPQRAAAQDVEVSLMTYLNRVPNAVAVMDPAVAGGASNRTMLQQMVAITQATGHGLVSVERGLNAAQQVASSQGVPNATIFRVLDEKGETAGTMRRYLDRAAFKAGQQGQVVVLGHTRPETLATLIAWALAGKGGDMNLAPISALLTGQ